MTKKIAVIVGSLRKESYNRKMAKVLSTLAPKSLNLQIIEIGDLPLYNQDLDEENPHAAWIQFREQMKTCQGVLFVTPEYNRSIPGALKNAIDVGSRPYGQSIWNKLPGAVISVSLGAIGGFGANHHLRQCFVFFKHPHLTTTGDLISEWQAIYFDSQGNLTKADTREFLQKFMEAYADWVKTNGV